MTPASYSSDLWPIRFNIYIYVCVCVCVCIYMYVCMYVCMFTALLICSLSIVKYNEHNLEKQGIGSSEVL